MAETYNIVWLVNKLKLYCAGVNSYIDKFYCAFHTLKAFYSISQQSGETVTNYFDRSKLARVNAGLKKNLTTHEELEKAERDDGSNTNPGKLAGDIFLAMDFLACAEPVRYKTL